MNSIQRQIRAPIVLEVDAVVAGGLSVPLTFRISEGEIVSLFLGPKIDRRALLRTLARRDAPTSGDVRTELAVALVSPGSIRTAAFLAPPRIMLLDDIVDAVDPVSERDAWARLAAERAYGTAIVVATSSVDRAYRADRVILAGWSIEGLVRELNELFRHMRPLVTEVLASLDGHDAEIRTKVTMLRRLKRACQDLVGAARTQAAALEAMVRVHELAAELAGLSVDERILDAIARDESRPQVS